jgi:shikimate kinase
VGFNQLARPRIVEIIGPAGAGKTTLCKLLSRSYGVRLSTFPDVRKAVNAPFFILHGLRLVPVLTRGTQFRDGRLSRREFAWLTILSGWTAILQKELRKNNSIILLDQGPVYLLSEVGEHGSNRLRGEQIWQVWYRQWAAMLDAFVWLDAADECLLERIRNRDKEHPVKNKPAHVVSEFLARYRRAYEDSLSRLTDNRSGIKILRFDTTRQLPEVIANQLLEEFGLQTALLGDGE